MNNKAAEDKIREYLQMVFAKKRLNSTEKEFWHELEAHVWDLYDGYLEEGFDAEQAVEQALRDIGEPSILRDRLKKDTISQNALTLLCSLLIMIFMGFSYKVYYDTGDWNGLIANICWMLTGVLLLFGVPYINIEGLRKYSFSIVGISVLTDFLLTVILKDIYGIIPYNYKIIFSFLYLIFGGYLLEDFEVLHAAKKRLGMLLIFASLILALFSNQKITAVILVLGYFILAFQLRKQKSGRYMFRMFFIFAVMILVMFGVIFLFGDEHQVNSLRMLLSMKKHTGLEENQAEIRSILLEAGFLGGKDVEYIRGMSEDGLYIPAYIAGKYGLFSLFLIGTLYVIQIYILLRRIRFYTKEKKIGIMLLSVYIFRIFYALLMNLDIVPITSIGLPILSYDRWIFIFDCLCIGYLLDVFIYRRKWKKG